MLMPHDPQASKYGEWVKDDAKKALGYRGAGFVGSHLVDRLMQQGEEVLCLDNYFTGCKDNIRQWIGHENFELIATM